MAPSKPEGFRRRAAIRLRLNASGHDSFGAPFASLTTRSTQPGRFLPISGTCYGTTAVQMRLADGEGIPTPAGR